VNYFSFFDGIGATHAALLPLGYQCIGVSEIDKQCNKLLETKFGFRNYGNFTNWKSWNFDKPFDLTIGGSPCQSFSSLGKRQGTESPNGQLTMQYVDFICSHRPKYFLWENVAAVLTHDGGRMFRWMLHQFTKFGYGLAWRVLNCRHFGGTSSAQHRRRVFALGCFDDPTSAAKILFESPKVSGCTKTSHETGKENLPAVAFGHCTDSMQNQKDRHRERYRLCNPILGTLTCQIDAGAEQVDRIVVDGGRPRYLLPREYELLQGFESDYTLGFSDSARYKMIGNSMPVPVIRWLGQRILAVDTEVTALARSKAS
jgi:DNA (cytosine-5)-methyltransferase 1